MFTGRDCELKMGAKSNFLQLVWYAPVKAEATRGQARGIFLDNPVKLAKLIQALTARYNSLVELQNALTEVPPTLATLASGL